LRTKTVRTHRQTDRQTDRHTPMITIPCGLRRAGNNIGQIGDISVSLVVKQYPPTDIHA